MNATGKISDEQKQGPRHTCIHDGMQVTSCYNLALLTESNITHASKSLYCPNMHKSIAIL